VKTRLGRHAVCPVVVGDVVTVGSFTAGLIGIRVRKDGSAFQSERAWTLPGLGVNFSSPVAIGPRVYGLGPGNSLFCIDPQTGEKAWVREQFFGDTVETGWASFVAMGSNLLALTDKGALLLLAVDPTGCRELGRATVCGRNWCSPAVADGRVYFRDAKELRCMKLAP
jgi:outer membrane protein assembly factor BamB